MKAAEGEMKRGTRKIGGVGVRFTSNCTRAPLGEMKRRELTVVGAKTHPPPITTRSL